MTVHGAWLTYRKYQTTYIAKFKGVRHDWTYYEASDAYNLIRHIENTLSESDYIIKTYPRNFRNDWAHRITVKFKSKELLNLIRLTV